MNKRIELLTGQVREHLQQDNDDGLQNVFELTHPSDLARMLRQVKPAEARCLFAKLPAAKKIEILTSTTAVAASFLLKNLSDQELVSIVAKLPPGRVTDILQTLGAEEVEHILALIDDEEFRRRLVDLLSYPHDTAGGIMNTEYIIVDEKQSVEQTLDILEEKSDRQTIIHYIYTMNEDRGLSGVISLRRLLQADRWDELRDYTHKELFKVRVDDDQEKAARLMQHYDLLAVPVVDHQDRLCGLVTAADAENILRREITEDIYRQAGLTPYEELATEQDMNLARGNLWSHLSLRLPWLVILSFAMLGLAGIISTYGKIISDYIELVFFLPLAAAMGGEVAVQSTTIFVRELDLEHLDLQRFWPRLGKEIFQSGIAPGLFFAAFTGLCVWMWQVYIRFLPPAGEGLIFSAVVAISVFISMVAASVSGFLLPYLFYRSGADPVNVSSPLLRAVHDIISVTVYLTTAILLLA